MGAALVKGKAEQSTEKRKEPNAKIHQLAKGLKNDESSSIKKLPQMRLNVFNPTERKAKARSWAAQVAQKKEEELMSKEKAAKEKEVMTNMAINKFREKLNEDGKVWLFQVVNKEDVILEGDMIAVKGQKQKYVLEDVMKLNKNNEYLMELLHSLKRHQYETNLEWE